RAQGHEVSAVYLQDDLRARRLGRLLKRPGSVPRAFDQTVCAPEVEKQLTDREAGRASTKDERVVQPARPDARILTRVGAAEAREKCGKSRRADLRLNHFGRPGRKLGGG